jgi:hypothetical protein
MTFEHTRERGLGCGEVVEGGLQGLGRSDH